MKKFAFVTDIHLDEKEPQEFGVDASSHWEQIITDLQEKEIDEIIFGGDIGAKTAHETFFSSLQFSSKLNIILGNHDNYQDVKKHYGNKYLVADDGLYYSYEDNFIKYIFLDSSPDEISATQFKWFQREIETLKKIVLFIHHPILSVNTAADEAYPLRNRNQLEEELCKCNNEVVIFCGHYHTADEQARKNITQIITPAASFQIKKNVDKIEVATDHFGYRIITLDKNDISTELVLFKSTKIPVVNCGVR
ncbi:MAG TPA: metallophosphoesterase [Flavobacterium sp.]|jgi:Icc protein|nr:metallophosphoesterase [Flavobacterium sp.]